MKQSDKVKSAIQIYEQQIPSLQAENSSAQQTFGIDVHSSNQRLNTHQLMQQRARGKIKSQGSGQIRPRKRYYNGVGKVNLPIELPQRNKRNQMQKIQSMRGNNAMRGTVSNYKQPYPNYAFNLNTQIEQQSSNLSDFQKVMSSGGPGPNNESGITMTDGLKHGGHSAGTRAEGDLNSTEYFNQSNAKVVKGLNNNTDQTGTISASGVCLGATIGHGQKVKTLDYQDSSIGIIQDDTIVEEVDMSLMTYNNTQNLPKIKFKLIDGQIQVPDIANQDIMFDQQAGQFSPMYNNHMQQEKFMTSIGHGFNKAAGTFTTNYQNIWPGHYRGGQTQKNLIDSSNMKYLNRNFMNIQNPCHRDRNDHQFLYRQEGLSPGIASLSSLDKRMAGARYNQSQQQVKRFRETYNSKQGLENTYQKGMFSAQGGVYDNQIVHAQLVGGHNMLTNQKDAQTAMQSIDPQMTSYTIRDIRPNTNLNTRMRNNLNNQATTYVDNYQHQQLTSTLQNNQMPQSNFFSTQSRSLNNIKDSMMGSKKECKPKQGIYRRKKYEYNVKSDELHENELTLSPGNIYHEQNNPHMAKFVNSVQGNIKDSVNKRIEMKSQVHKIFSVMRKEKNQYIQTLLDGEENGHCRGIKKRVDPTTKYRLQQQMLKYKQIQEERVEQIKAIKKQKDKERLEVKRQRIAERLNQIEIIHSSRLEYKTSNQNSQVQLDKTIGRKVQIQISTELDTRTGDHSRQRKSMTEQDLSRIHIAKKASDYSGINKNEAVVTPKMDGALRTDVTPIKSHEDMTDQNFDLIMDKQQNTNIADLDHKGDSIKGSDVGPISDANQMIQSQSKWGWGKLASHTLASDRKHNKPAQKQHISSSQRKLKVLKDSFGFKNLSKDQIYQFDQLLQSTAANNNNALNKIIKNLQSENFVQFRQLVNKTPGSMNPKQSSIFSSYRQLGLADNEKFQNFFRHLCEEDVSLKYCRLKRSALKEFLQDRYSKLVGERILLFLENQFNSLYRIDFPGFCNVIMELLNSGPECYKKMLFACLSLTNPGQICEHDIFSLIENFKQRESYFFYQELITQKDVPRDYQDVIDDSDSIFFEAFASDIKDISHALNLRKRLFGINDQDTNKDLRDDMDPKNYPSEEMFEEDIINQIDYIIGMIFKKSGQQYQTDVVEILLQNSNLRDIRVELCRLISGHKLLQKKETKKQSIAYGSIDTKNDQAAVNFFKPPQNVVPCLGHGIVPRTGNKITDCLYVTFEDFNKLVHFKKAKVSSFVEDLIYHITIGLISVENFELHLGSIRDMPNSKGFTGKDLREYLDIKNKELYGLSGAQGRMVNKRNTTLPETQTHVITAPYTFQDHYVSGEFAGKLLLKKVVIKKDSKQKQGEADRPGDSDSDRDVDAEGDHREDSYNSRTNMILINELKVNQLMAFRQHFGSANFFKIFRCFYKLCNIPDDCQNNPFDIYMEKNSAVRGFEEVFGVKNEEVAIRFNQLFLQPLNQPKMYHIDILRFFYVIQHMCDTNDKVNQNYLKFAFNFYDYDNSGNIGSVDIINLKKNLNKEDMDNASQIFNNIMVVREKSRRLNLVQSSLKNNLLRSINRKKSKIQMVIGQTPAQHQPLTENQNKFANLALLTFGKQKKEQQNSSLHVGEENESQHNCSADHESSQPKDSSEIKKRASIQFVKQKSAQQMEEQELYEKSLAIGQDPWLRFLFEVKQLRDYFVNEAILPRNTTLKHTFLDFKRFEQKLLPHLQQKFNVQTPTLVYFFKSKFEYQFNITNKDIEEETMGTLFTGFTLEGKKSEDVRITEELIEMQKTLDFLSSQPKPFVAFE